MSEGLIRNDLKIDYTFKYLPNNSNRGLFSR